MLNPAESILPERGPRIPFTLTYNVGKSTKSIEIETKVMKLASLKIIKLHLPLANPVRVHIAAIGKIV